MRIPYLKIAGLVAVGAIVGALAEASRSPSTSIEPAAPPTEVAGQTVTTLCIFSMTGAKIEINCNSDDVKAFLEDQAR